jgi:chitodextrinase
MTKYLLTLTAFIFIVTCQIASAQSGEFIVRLLIGGDNAAPSTPVLLSANPATQTQVDLSWSTSTDNFLVSGYVVYRGSTTIATTTELNYFDTGLNASTSYSYFVKAFDPSFNYSSSSNVIEATTPGYPVTPTIDSPDSLESTSARVVMDGIEVTTGRSTSTLKVSTAYQARLELRWGKSSAYELGYVVSGVYKKVHHFSLSDLEPGTTYEYEIIGYTPFGNERIIKKGTFATKENEDLTPPANVGKFTAISENNDVYLSWKLPVDEDLSHVRIVRSHLGYPSYPIDGAIVYQGTGMSFKDKDILLEYSPVYYTAFVYDNKGNISSGAITVAFSQGNTPGGLDSKTEGLLDFVGTPGVYETASSSLNADRLTSDMRMPDISDISITQVNLNYIFDNADIYLDGQNSFSVHLPKDKVVGNLKSIIVSVLDPTDNRKSYSYLLKINQERTAYTATIPAINVFGDSQIRVEIYDYEAFVVGTYQTPVTYMEGVVRKTGYAGFEDMLKDSLGEIFVVAAGIPVIIFLSVLLLQRRYEDNE